MNKSFYIKSQSNPHIIYAIFPDKEGNLACGCTYYLIKHKECYHIKEAMGNEGTYQYLKRYYDGK